MSRIEILQLLLLPPNVAELSSEEQGWVRTAIQAFNGDEYLQRGAGYSRSVNPTFVGFYVDREDKKAWPVFRTDNSLMIIRHNERQGNVVSGAVSPENVYAIDFYDSYLTGSAEE